MLESDGIWSIIRLATAVANIQMCILWFSRLPTIHKIMLHYLFAHFELKILERYL